jgi:hypothetical protein
MHVAVMRYEISFASQYGQTTQNGQIVVVPVTGNQNHDISIGLALYADGTKLAGPRRKQSRAAHCRLINREKTTAVQIAETPASEVFRFVLIACGP